MEDMRQTVRRSRDRLTDLFAGEEDPSRRDQPPFQVRDLKKIYAITAIDPDRVQPFLPPGLKVAASATGVMSLNINGGGTWGQYSCGLHGVAVEGMESPDGMEAVYWLGGCSHDGGYQMFRRFFLHSVREGSCSIAYDGRTVTGDSRLADGTGRLSIHMTRITDPEVQLPATATQDSSYHYLGDGPDGRARIFSMYAYGKKVIAARLDGIEMSNDLPPPLLALTPVALKWGVFFESMDLVYSPPRPIDIPHGQLRADHARGSLLSVIDRHVSPAIVMDGANRLRFVNRAAGARLGGWVRPGQTFASDLPAVRAALALPLESVRAGQAV